MTIAELRNEVRRLVPQRCSTCVELVVWDYSHSGKREVTVGISVVWGGRCEIVSHPTCERALADFQNRILPEIDPAPQAAAEIDALLNESPEDFQPSAVEHV